MEATTELRELSTKTPYKKLQENSDDEEEGTKWATNDNEHADDKDKDKEVRPTYVDPFKYDEVKSGDFWRSVIAEFLATNFFVAFSTLGIISALQVFADSPGAAHAFIVAYHFILSIIVIYAFAHLSGAHFNPAVTITVLFCGRITIIRCLCYVVAQILGAIAGAGFADLTVPSDIKGTLGQPLLMPGISPGSGFLMEFYCTFGLLFGSFATAFDPRGWGKLGPIAVSFIVAINIHAGSFVSGPAMNPARAFGPAVVRDCWTDHWVYWVGDLAGGILGGVLYEYLFMARTEPRILGVPSLSGDNFGVTKEKKEQ